MCTNLELDYNSYSEVTHLLGTYNKQLRLFTNTWPTIIPFGGRALPMSRVGRKVIGMTKPTRLIQIGTL